MVPPLAVFASFISRANCWWLNRFHFGSFLVIVWNGRQCWCCWWFRAPGTSWYTPQNLYPCYLSFSRHYVRSYFHCERAKTSFLQYGRGLKCRCSLDSFQAPILRIFLCCHVCSSMWRDLWRWCDGGSCLPFPWLSCQKTPQHLPLGTRSFKTLTMVDNAFFLNSNLFSCSPTLLTSTVSPRTFFVLLMIFYAFNILMSCFSFLSLAYCSHRLGTESLLRWWSVRRLSEVPPVLETARIC